jgi:hypothetical protein
MAPCVLPGGHAGDHEWGPERRSRATNAATLADLVGRLAPDEPVFVLIGRDLLAPLAIQQYAEGARRAGREDFAADVEARGIEFLRWQAANRDRVKLPD